MKKTKKLSLNKATVSKLDGSAIYGGISGRRCPESFDICNTDDCGTDACPSAGCPTGTCNCPSAACSVGCPSADCTADCGTADCGTVNCTYDYNCAQSQYARPVCPDVPYI